MSEVRIRVKCASTNCDDIELISSPSATVSSVKKQIKAQFPLHPEVEEQRLIYAGHLLEDTQILGDIFQQGNQMSVSGGYTFHLACNSAFLNKTIKSGVEESKRRAVSDDLVGQSSSGELPNVEIRNRGGVPVSLITQHQQYVEQMMNFMTQWNEGQNIRNSTNIVQNENIPPVVNNNVVNNVVNNVEEGRDVLDWIYTSSRFLIILSLVYFYSNLSRLLLVLLFTTLILIVQRRPAFLNGFLNWAGFQNPLPPAPQNPPPPPQQQQENREEGENSEEGNGADEILGGGQDDEERLNRFDLTRTFMTFFTSLIPEV